jgi:hypothetical protein
MEFIDHRIDENSRKLVLIYPNGKEKKIEFLDIKDVFVLKESLTSPIKWYHRFVMGIILIALFTVILYRSLQFLDSGELDSSPILSEILFYVVLIFTIVSLVAIGIMVHIGISGGPKFISYYAVRFVFTRKRKYFVIATARKEYKLQIKNTKQFKEYKLKASKIRNNHLS